MDVLASGSLIGLKRPEVQEPGQKNVYTVVPRDVVPHLISPMRTYPGSLLGMAVWWTGFLGERLIPVRQEAAEFLTAA